MNKAKYPNRNALNQALDHYLDAMFQFVSECLDERSIKETLRLLSGGDLRKEIEVKDIADLIKKYWSKSFKAKFKIIDRGDIRYYDARSVTSLIIEGRNQASHQRLKELDPEFTRSQLFLIAEVLGKINRPDAQREVEVIRDELFENTTQQLIEAAVEKEEAQHKKSIAKVKERLAAEKESNKELSKQVDDNTTELNKKAKKLDELSEQLFAAKETKKQFDSKSRELKKVQAAHSKCAERLTSTETERDDYKKRLETASEQLDEVGENLSITSDQLLAAKAERDTSTEHLAAIQKLLIASTISDQSVFPPLKTHSAVRILDRRGIDKKNYLLNLLEQKQPTVIYVQSEEMVDLLLERVVPEKANLIEKHDKQTSEAEETELLEKLENGELIAVVSDTTVSTLVESHCVEHFVFCHLAPSLGEFFKQSEPAFKSEKDSYLHLIFDSEQDIKALNQWLTRKYPDAEALGKLYRELRELARKDGNFIKPEDVYNENVYSKLGMAKLGIETSLTIFEELQFLERNESGVELLPDPEKRGLNESEIHCGGEELKQGVAEAQAFQLKQPVDQIWEEVLAKLNLDSTQILRERNTHNYSTKDEVSMPYAFPDAPEDSETQSEQSSTEVVESESIVDNEDTEASQAPEPPRANAKVTEKQVREIRSRSAAGESNSERAEEDSEKRPEVKQSEFWQPIRAGEFGALFAGKPVPVRDDGWISKRIRGVELILSFRQNRSYVSFLCRGENRIERRDEIIALFPEADYDYSPHESPQRAGFRFPVINKGKDHPEDWDEIRKKLVAMGTDIYNKIDESDL